MQKLCEECGDVIPPQKGSARPRKYCERCRPPRNRKNPRVIELPTAAMPEAPAVDEAPLVNSYRKQLEQAERLDTPEGAHVILLARMLESGAMAMTASGAASLSKELRAAMEVALSGAPKAEDALDELANRRRKKAAGA